MGLLNLNHPLEDTNLPPEASEPLEELDVPPYALATIYMESDILAPLYSDTNLTLIRANPVQADANGTFPECYLIEGLYRLVITDAQEQPLADFDPIYVKPNRPLSFVRGFKTLEELLENTALRLSNPSNGSLLVAGDSLHVAEGNFVYQVAADTSTDHDLITAGGLKLYATGTFVRLDQFGKVSTDEADVVEVTAAWLRMIAYGKRTGAEISVPPTPPEKYWPINYPGQAFDGMRLRMDGHIRNIWTSNGATRGSLYGDHFCILFGTCDANSFNNMVSYPVGPVNEGDTIIQLTNIADAAQFEPGDVIAWKSAEGDTITGSFKPHDQMLNEVRSVNLVTGQLTVLYSFRDSFGGAGPKIVNASRDTTAKIALGNIPARAVKDVTVYGPGGFSSAYERWTGFGGCLRPSIKTRVRGAVGAFSVNAMAFGEVDIWGTVYQAGFEIAWYAHDLFVQSTGGLYFVDNPNKGSIHDSSVFYANEFARRITFDNITAFATGAFFQPTTAVALTISSDCRIGDNVVVNCNATQFLLDITAAAADCGGHRIGRAKFTGDAPSALRTRESGVGNLTDIIFDGTEFHGTFSAYGLNIEGTDQHFINVYHESGHVLVRSGSQGIWLRGVDSDAVPTITDNTNQTIILRCYREAETKATGVLWRGDWRSITLNDDQAVAIRPPSPVCKVEWTAGANLNNRGTAHFNTNSPSLALDTNVTGSGIAVATGKLLGTTGADTKLNVSTFTDGYIYFENRTGASMSLMVTMFG